MSESRVMSRVISRVGEAGLNDKRVSVDDVEEELLLLLLLPRRLPSLSCAFVLSLELELEELLLLLELGELVDVMLVELAPCSLRRSLAIAKPSPQEEACIWAPGGRVWGRRGRGGGGVCEREVGVYAYSRGKVDIINIVPQSLFPPPFTVCLAVVPVSLVPVKENPLPTQKI